MKILLGAMGLGAMLAVILLGCVCLCALKKPEPAKSDCIVVLGARVWPDGRMSNSLRYRCESALQAWQQGIAPAIIVCGGQGRDEPVTEAAAMAAYLAENGVPSEAIFIEDASTDTRENLRFARAIMEDQGFETAAICTSDYHLTRAMWLARDTGISATGISARSPKTVRSFVFGRCREAVSWALYFLKMI